MLNSHHTSQSYLPPLSFQDTDELYQRTTHHLRSNSDTESVSGDTRREEGCYGLAMMAFADHQGLQDYPESPCDEGGCSHVHNDHAGGDDAGVFYSEYVG